MSTTTRTLTGARWSSATRCIARASHEGLGSHRDDEAQQYLQKYFTRGVNVGKAWALGKREELMAEGHDVVLEAEVPWGRGWTGHVDLLDMTARVAYETYHAVNGEFREVKALQIAGYCDELGDDWKAELAVVDTSDLSDDEGFAVQPYEIHVPGLLDRVHHIKERVIANVEAGSVDPADRVSDTPNHSECRGCVFASICHAGWRPPVPDSIVGLETKFEELRITESDLHHAEAAAKLVKERRDGLRDQVREFLPAGQVVECGGTTIKRTEVAGRLSVKLGDYLKAGFEVPDELDAFVSEGKPSERWKVDSTGGTA